MVPDPSMTRTGDTPPRNRDSSPVINAIIGAVTGIILSFIPLSTLLGGAVAGYLEGGEQTNGLRVGAYAGFIMLIPFVLFGVFFMFFLGFGAGNAPIGFGVMAFVMLIIGALYTVGLSVVGGYLGVYLKNEL